jgi:hypothetical protein
MTTETKGYMSGFAGTANRTQTKALSHTGLGQSCPRHYPGSENPLGRPLSIKDVARLIGCSAWTVRQKYVPSGLPHLRSGPSGRLTFFENQVVAWVLAQQQGKGGNHT